MRVHINHREETRGFIRKTTLYFVNVRADFSEEEKQIIEDQGIGTVIVLERKRSEHLNDIKVEPEFWYLRIENLMDKGDDYALSSRGEAKQYAAAVEEALPQVKEYIMSNAEIDERSKTIEL